MSTSSPPVSNYSNTPLASSATRYKTLDDVKVSDIKYSDIEEREDGTKLVNGELCYRPHDAIRNDAGDWVLISNRIGDGLTQGNSRLNSRFGEVDKFMVGDKVVVPAPLINQLCDGGVLRLEQKEIGGVLHGRVEWIRTREGSNNNLLDYLPCWVQMDNILLYCNKTRIPPPAPAASEETSASAPRRESRDHSWTFEALRPLSLNKEVVADKEGKLFVMVSKSKKDHCIWGRPVSATGIPEGTRYDLKCIGIESLGLKTLSFPEAKSGFEPTRCKDEIETKELRRLQAERTRSLQTKSAILGQAAVEAKAKKQEVETKKTPEEEKPNGKQDEEAESPETQPLGLDGENVYEDLDVDFLAQFNEGGEQVEEPVTSRESLIEEFGLPVELLDEPGAQQLMDAFLRLRRQADDAQEEISGWRDLQKRYHRELSVTKLQRTSADVEQKETINQLKVQIEEIRMMGAGFGSLMKTMANILGENVDTSESLKALVQRMAEELKVKLVQPGNVPNVFGKDLAVQFENFVKFFGSGTGGSIRMTRPDQPTTLQPSTPSSPLLASNANSVQPKTTDNPVELDNTQQLLSTTTTNSSTEAAAQSGTTSTVSSPSVSSVLGLVGQKRSLGSISGGSTGGLRVITSAKTLSKTISASQKDSDFGGPNRPRGPWGVVNFLEEPYFTGTEFSQFVARLETRFKNKMKPSQVAAFSYMFWSHPNWNALQAGAQDIQQRVRQAQAKITKWQEGLVNSKYKIKSVPARLSSSDGAAKSRSPSPVNVLTGRGSRGSRGGGRQASGRGRGRGGGGRGAPAGKSKSTYVPTVPDENNPYSPAPISPDTYEPSGWGTIYSFDDLDFVYQKFINKNPNGSTYELISYSLNHMLQVLVLRELTDFISCFLDLSLSLRALRVSLNNSKLTFGNQVRRCKGQPWFWAAIDQLCGHANRNVDSLLEVGDHPILLLVDKCVRNCSVWLSRGVRGRDILAKDTKRKVMRQQFERQTARYRELLPTNEAPPVNPLEEDDDDEDEEDDEENADTDEYNEQNELLSSTSPAREEDDNELLDLAMGSQMQKRSHQQPPAKKLRQDDDDDE